MPPSEAARAVGAARERRAPRSAEEQVALDAECDAALPRSRENGGSRRRQEREFVEPQFSRRAVIDALGLEDAAFANWIARRQICLDADDVRDGGDWRRFSARDVLRIALAVHLHRFGVSAPLLNAVIGRVEARFPLSPRNFLLAENIPCALLVLPSVEVAGPFVGREIEVEGVDAGAFIVLRIDRIIQRALERLGWSVKRDGPDELSETVDSPRERN